MSRYGKKEEFDHAEDAIRYLTQGLKFKDWKPHVEPKNGIERLIAKHKKTKEQKDIEEWFNRITAGKTRE